MTVSVEVLAVRETPPQLNAMLAVVEACKMAGTSYPSEVSEFFGDALTIHGPDAVKLRAALASVELPVTGDLMSDEGLLIDLASIPHDVATIRVRAAHDGQAIGGAVMQPPEPDELDFPLELDDPTDSDDAVDMDESDEFMVVGEEPVNIAEADTSLQLDGLASADEEESDEEESDEEESDDIMDEYSPEEESGDTVIMKGDPLDIVDDFDAPLTLEEPEVPMARPILTESQASLVVPDVPPPAQQRSPAPPPNVDEIDDLVLAVEDDLLDLDDLDKPLEFDTPAPAPSVDIDDPVAAVEDDLLDLDDFEETPHPNPNAPPLPPPRRLPPG